MTATQPPVMFGLIALVKCLIADIYLKVFGLKGTLADVYETTAKKIPDDISIEQARNIRLALDGILNADCHPRRWVDKRGADHRVLAFEKDMPELVDYLRIEERIEEIEAYLGSAIKSWFLMANRIDSVPGNLGSGGGVHRDSPYAHQIKMIWYLSDVDEENGPFQYVAESHRSVIKTRHLYPLGVTRFDRFHESSITLTGKAGTLLICDTKCLHRGAPIKKGSRYALTLYTSTNIKSREGRVVNLDD